MEEKILAKSVRGNKTAIICSILILIGIILFAYGYSTMDSYDKRSVGLIWAFMSIGPFAVLAALLYWSRSNCSMTITDKRVFGKAKFKKGVDLPIDSISAVGTSAFDGLTVSTSSGIIKFADIKNRDEMQQVLRNLLIGRQNKTEHIPTTTIKQEMPKSEADELKKFKELLDNGIITQEEFDAKKKQLLGL